MTAAGVVEIDLSGIRLRIAGLDAYLERRLREECAPFLAAGAARPTLDVAVQLVEGDAGVAWEPKAMRSRFAPGRATFETHEGRAEARRGGQLQVRLSRDLAERGYHALANFLRAGLAWTLCENDGALLHAAGIVLDGRGFVLVGASGSGKTTWSRLAAAAGAEVIGDDLALISGLDGAPELLAAPLKTRFRTRRTPGRWPLGALLFPRHGSPPALASVTGLVASARLAANLTFIADAVESDPCVAALLDRLVAAVPCAELTFDLEGRFVELLRGWPGPPAGGR